MTRTQRLKQWPPIRAIKRSLWIAEFYFFCIPTFGSAGASAVKATEVPWRKESHLIPKIPPESSPQFEVDTKKNTVYIWNHQLTNLFKNLETKKFQKMVGDLCVLPLAAYFWRFFVARTLQHQSWDREILKVCPKSFQIFIFTHHLPSPQNKKKGPHLVARKKIKIKKTIKTAPTVVANPCSTPNSTSWIGNAMKCQAQKDLRGKCLLGLKLVDTNMFFQKL